MSTQFLVLGRRQDAPVQWRRWVWFNVDFRFAPADVIATVVDALHSAPIERVAADPPPNCILMDLQESVGRYAVRYWLTDLASDDPTDSVVRNRIYFALKRAGIPLSMPAHKIFMTEESAARRDEKDRQERQRRLKALSHVDFFVSLPESLRARLAAGLRHAPFSPGEVMTHQGAEAHWLYLIIEGEASVEVTEANLEREVARLGKGQFFGEMSLMTGEPRSATVIARTPVDCYRLDKSVFQDILHERPELAERVADVLAKRRVELMAVKEGLDAEAAERHLTLAKEDLTSRIRSFFGIEKDAGQAAG
jgi:CRP-like cAMP-binding protein